MKKYTVYQTLERYIEIEAENYGAACEAASSATQDEWSGCVEAERVTAVVDGHEVDVTGGEDE